MLNDFGKTVIEFCFMHGFWILFWQTWNFFHHTTYWYSPTKIWLMIIFLGTNSLGKPLSLARWYTMGWNNFWRSILKFLCPCCFHKILRTQFTTKSIGVQRIFCENTGPWKSEHILSNCDMIGRTMWVLGAPSYSKVRNKREDSNKRAIFLNLL